MSCRIGVLAMGLLLGACGAPRPMPPLPPLTGPRTCPSAPDSRSVASVKLDTEAGDVDGVRYYFGYLRGQSGLIWLDDTGNLAAHPLPLKPRAYCTEEPGGLRCFKLTIPKAGKYHQNTALETVHVAIAKGEKPTVGEAEVWTGAPWMKIVRMTSNGTRAAVLFRERGGRSRHFLAMWDVASGHRLGPIHEVGHLQPKDLWCHARGCVILTERHFKKRGWYPSVIRISDKGRRVIERVTLDRTSDLIAVRGDDRRFLVWADSYYRQLRVAGFATSGKLVVGPRGAPPRYTISRTKLFTLPGSQRFLLRSFMGWALASVTRDGRVREPHRAGLFQDRLQAGRVGDGFLVAGIEGGAMYDSGESGLQLVYWQSEPRAYFVTDEDPDNPRPGRPKGKLSKMMLLSEDRPTEGSDERGGGYKVRILTRPERAAALVFSYGEVASEPRLLPLREPCSSESELDPDFEDLEGESDSGIDLDI